MRKKFFATLAALVAGLMILPFGTVNLTAEGAFNPNKDPNGDGVLEIADAIYISQYLCGLFNPTDLSQLDVDDNDVVSIVDEIYVQMYEAGSITLRGGNEVSPDSINSFTTTNYLVYDAQNATYLRSYSLNVNDSNNTGGTRGIVGTTDDRITDWSNEGVAKIMTPSWYRGTGFVVDEHTIATAAHVVFNTTTDTPYEINNIYLFDSDSTAHSFTPVEYHIPLTYKNHNSYNTGKDYALITVEEDLSDYMTFKLGAITNSASTNNLSITSVGFPSEMYYGGAWHNGVELSRNVQSENTQNHG